MSAEPTVESPPTAPGSMRRLGRDAFLYGAGVVLSRAVSFLLLPVYTRYLSPADFGLLQLLQMVIDVVSIVVSAGTTAGVLRFYFKAETEEERGRVVVTAFYLLAGLNLLGAVLLTPLSPFLWRHALGYAGSPALIPLAAANFVLEACITVPFLFMQALGRAALYSSITLAKLLLGLGLNVLFVVGMGEGVGGILVANLITNVLVGGALALWMFRRTGLRPSAAAARDLRRYGLPYQLVTAGTFVLTFGDRAFLQAFHGLTVVGLYGLAYQFGFLLINLTSAPFFRAWAPERLRLAASAPREARDARYNQAFRLLNVIVFTAAVAMSVFAWPALAVMSAPAFRPAAALVPLIVAAFVFQIWTDVVALGIEVSERTKYASLATWISVVVILGLYAGLIPPLGGAGAALATLGGNLVRFGCFLRWSQRLWPVSWEWGQAIRLGIVSVAVVAAAHATTPPSWIGQVAIASVAFAAFLVAVWLAILSPRERSLLLGVLRSPRTAIAELVSA